MSALPHRAGTGTTRPGPSTDAGVTVLHQPILDVARGTAAGYHAVAEVSRGRLADPVLRWAVTMRTIDAALTAAATLPTNTFISVPVPLDLVGDPAVRSRLADHGQLGGVVLDVTDFSSDSVSRAVPALDDYRAAGARIAVGGRDDAQPELGSIVRLRPAVIRLGAAWTRGIDTHPSRRAAIEVTGQLAGQLDAWILADAVETAAELRVLAQLGVPLARGPFIGAAGPVWSAIPAAARTALPPSTRTVDGVLRSLLQQAYTTRHPEAARAVLAESTGFEHVVVIDEAQHPVALLHHANGGYEPVEVLAVNVDTSVTDAVSRAMARPADRRFSPICCTDDAGRFVGILRMERLVAHLVDGAAEPRP
jgi:EAL domain-containing protein (putative c-di-GMP-specific phosphodiesterase class I)